MNTEDVKKDWKDEDKALWSFLLHAESVITDRTNFFLVAESMFVTALAVSRNSGDMPLVNLIIIGGLCITSIWLLLGFKIYVRLNGIVWEVKQFYPGYGKLLEKYNFPISSNKSIAIIIPAIFIVGWLYLLFSCPMKVTYLHPMIYRGFE